METEKIKTAEERWPELEKAARYIELSTLQLVTQEKRRLMKKGATTCPYPAQCLIEMVIAKLQEVV